MMPAIASGQRTGERTFKTRPSPQTNAHKIATSSAIEKAVSDAQTIRACFSVGGGKLIIGSALAKLLRLLRRGSDGADQRGTHARALQLLDPFDRRPSRTGDHIFERSRMKAGFEHHSGAAK